MTDRQSKILVAIVEEYAEVASPVGSSILAKMFNVSPATIRNEMMVLEKAGFIAQPHTSAGRIPTDKGYRYYVNQLSGVAPTSINRSARAIDTRVQTAGSPDLAIRTAVKSLVELTHNVGLATINGALYVRGFADLFSQPEFSTTETVRQVASLIDNLEPWLRETEPNEALNVYIGRENPIGKSSQSSLIIARFCSPYSDSSYIGVLGPTRQNYQTVMNLVNHTGKMLEKELVNA